MIKINLLPKTIGQKRVVRNTAILMGFILVLVIAAGLAYWVKLKGDVARMEELAAATEAWKARVESIQRQAQEVRNQAKPIKEKLDFILAVLKYNEAFPELYEQIVKWTYEKVKLTSLQCDGQQVVMQAHVKNLDDLGRYLLNMYRAVDLFTEVTISGIPGYGEGGGQQYGAQSPQGYGGGEIGGSMAGLAGLQAIETGVGRAATRKYAPGGIDFTVTCKLKNPIMPPQFGGAAQQQGDQGGYGQPPMPMSTPPPMGPSGSPDQSPPSM